MYHSILLLSALALCVTSVLSSAAGSKPACTTTITQIALADITESLCTRTVTITLNTVSTTFIATKIVGAVGHTTETKYKTDPLREEYYGAAVHTQIVTVHIPGTTTSSLCLSQNQPPQGYPVRCSSTVQATTTGARYSVYSRIYSINYTATITATSTVYATYSTHYTQLLAKYSYKNKIRTEPLNSTIYAHTTTITGPVLATPTHFKLRVRDMIPNYYGSASEGKFLQESDYDVNGNGDIQSLFAFGNKSTGTVFNLTQLYNTTVLGRPNHNSTCGANNYLGKFVLDWSGVASLIACPDNQNGWDPTVGKGDDYSPDDYNSSRFLELQQCYMDCFHILRCAVGAATEFVIPAPYYPLCLYGFSAPDNYDDINYPGRCVLEVVPWLGKD